MTDQLIITLIPFVLILVGTTLRKFVFKEKSIRMCETAGRHIYLWGNGLLVLAAFISLFVLDMTDHNTVGWFWLIFFSVVMGFHSFVEWRYLKGSKEYIISLISLAIGLIIISLFVF